MTQMIEPYGDGRQRAVLSQVGICCTAFRIAPGPRLQLGLGHLDTPTRQDVPHYVENDL
jgi:hypothetical protein